MPSTSKSGFTLVEMSIVLVVIGLIVGSIIAGQAMIRSSGLRGTMSDITNFTSALGKFRLEFHSLPGDMSTATSYWGIAGGTGSDATCFGTNQSTTGTATCNGNGSGALDLTNSVTSIADATENYLAWKHIINAGLIDGPSLTGRTANTGGYGSVGGINTPPGKIDGTMYIMATNIGCKSSDATYFDGCYPLVLGVGANNATGFWPNNQYTPEEMYSMDKKMDDGLPGLGQFRTFLSASTCASSSTAYVLTTTTIVCRILYGAQPITAYQ